MNTRDKYEVVIGLEVHAQLLTKTKAYSSDINEYGAHPNTHVSVITLGHPGTLPVMNKKTIEFAVKLGLACGCTIAEHQHFARKNYFYPDLPKGYQITQDTTPICTGGAIVIKTENNEEKTIGLTRIHMEEDAGKSIHDVDLYDTLVDLNRAGTPLLEIVSEPEIRSSQEAYNYLTEVRRLVRYLDICDGNMEEGSLRCDANISVMLKGSNEFGTKVEVKNMNSIRNVQRAIEFEIGRQIAAIENGERISQETRSFDALKGITISMRSKEAANDYRYFPEPDLQPIVVDTTYVNQVKAKMPALPRELHAKYTQDLKLSDYDAGILTDSKSIALFFEEVISNTKSYKSAANWVMGEVKSYLNQNGLEIEDLPVSAKQIAGIINLIESGKVSNSAAAQKLFPALIASPDANIDELAVSLNIIQESNADSLKEVILGVFGQHPDEVSRFKAGENQLTGFFMGQIMKASGGKADPKTTNALLRELIQTV
ncbi:Asp-tRNA(Asn)/Glu-tRNA(Gln) amidotransferase subunit GatB [Fluviicola chungangensis]|uniref:Aspartyl/glutamyl-tRNA(Asn/Gln) amidotransferase subunit B n=1 Tax=Fluviicola chungangensis TaxID=2597671 RepID=A0A556MR89_9FLAO|nr:Asp-tRNA(Asn)/Glu-tRNA(Gln) amidotransferase subunit GatB [Fluviicola chungangensis]TSJ42362.1 Asp-tRNA(Asn)/Glu-tRNA(Gln) amidotransferase subunit GatB [Fluviicola chungangensis]